MEITKEQFNAAEQGQLVEIEADGKDSFFSAAICTIE